jgi:hypothetical protein
MLPRLVPSWEFFYRVHRKTYLRNNLSSLSSWKHSKMSEMLLIEVSWIFISIRSGVKKLLRTHPEFLGFLNLFGFCNWIPLRSSLMLCKMSFHLSWFSERSTCKAWKKTDSMLTSAGFFIYIQLLQTIRYTGSLDYWHLICATVTCWIENWIIWNQLCKTHGLLGF